MSTSKFNEALANMKPVELGRWRAEYGPFTVDLERKGSERCDPMSMRKLQKYAFEVRLGRHAYARKEDARVILDQVRKEILHFLYGDIKWMVHDLYSMWMSSESRDKIKDQFTKILTEMTYDQTQ